ncbi:DUF1616 domain-containing protein [Chloroflexota bacterium]
MRCLGLNLTKVLLVILSLALIGGIGGLSYIFVTQEVGEKFTEFYILGMSGKAEGYPKSVKLGDKGEVILGIINQEGEELSYWVEVMVDGEETGEIGLITLAHEQQWEDVVGFTPLREGESQKVEFRLYKVRRLGMRGDTMLRLELEKVFSSNVELGLDRKGFDAVVQNIGAEESSYEVRLVGKDGGDTHWVGQVTLKQWEEWGKAAYFEEEKGKESEFQLLKDGEIIYRENVGQYPSLHLWVDVKAAEAGTS